MRNLLIVLLLLCCMPFVYAQQAHTQAVDQVLSQFHQAAAKADWDHYFSLLSDGAIFLGTDATERWTKEEFEGYARPTQGWTYTEKLRHIIMSADNNTAWFDELLWNDSYGECRGSGVLVNEGSGWRLVQYNLTIPIPNSLARQITEQIIIHNQP